MVRFLLLFYFAHVSACNVIIVSFAHVSACNVGIHVLSGSPDRFFLMEDARCQKQVLLTLI